MHEFKTTKFNGEWTTFSSGIAIKISSGELITKELCLFCKISESAKALAGLYPDSLFDYLNGKPEVVEFPDGSGAVRFFVNDGAQIITVLASLGKGNYGGVPLKIGGGICPGLPRHLWPQMQQMLGLQQVIGLGDTFAW